MPQANTASGYLLLGAAIVCEVIGTISIKLSDGFKFYWWAIVALICYGAAIVLLAFAVTIIELGIAYTIW
jgi:small multidrug resistance pump